MVLYSKIACLIFLLVKYETLKLAWYLDYYIVFTRQNTNKNSISSI